MSVCLGILSTSCYFLFSPSPSLPLPASLVPLTRSADRSACLPVYLSCLFGVYVLGLRANPPVRLSLKSRISLCLCPSISLSLYLILSQLLSAPLALSLSVYPCLCLSVSFLLPLSLPLPLSLLPRLAGDEDEAGAALVAAFASTSCRGSRAAKKKKKKRRNEHAEVKVDWFRRPTPTA